MNSLTAVLANPRQLLVFPRLIPTTPYFTKKNFRVQAAHISTKKTEVSRHSTIDFPPTIWGEHFLANASDVKEMISDQEKREHQRLKEEVKKMLTETPDESCKKLDLIDAIQRLGVSYHFENEIQASLQNIFDSFNKFDEEDDNDDLHAVALRFRLLRQHGHYVSCDIFNKFKNPEEKFDEYLVKNVRGMLSLYEASNFRIHGEDVLEEALIFTTDHLEFLTSNLSEYSLTAQVNHALNFPIQKTLPRLGARQFISLYQEDEFHDQMLLDFAKVDFNILQKEHRNELRDLTEWWKSLDCQKNFPFARDRLVENYFYWALGVFFEPHYSFARRMLAKLFAVFTIVDDAYDVYCTLDELILFTDSIERWDISALDQLPTCLRHLYQALFDVYSEMEENLAKAGISDRVQYAIDKMKKVTRAYFQQAKWFHNDYLPTVEEYMNTALVTSTQVMVATFSVVGMGDPVTTEALDWVTNEPSMLRATSTIVRLTDDLQESEFEQKVGREASAVECYMKEHGASKQEAIDEFRKDITNAWKDINKEWLDATLVPRPVLERVLNLTRVIYLLYKNGDEFTHCTARNKDLITLVLVDPVTL